MKNIHVYNGFDKDKVDLYKGEVKKRWGYTPAYEQSAERTKNWTKQQYTKVSKDQKAITQALANNSGKSPDSQDVLEIVDRHYQYISQFYDLSFHMYRALGNMYVTDPRFTAYYEKCKPNLAMFMKEAIEMYCQKHEQTQQVRVSLHYIPSLRK